jgi:site-specific recombinase XerD
MKRFFVHYLPIQKGLSDNTIMAYRDAIKLLLCYAADKLPKPVDKLTIEDIGEKMVIGFLDHVQQNRSCNPRTRNARLAAVSSLFRFIGREEPAVLPQCQEILTIPSKRTTHKTVDYLEEKEMQAVSATKLCCYCFTTPGLGLVRSLNSRSSICVWMPPGMSGSWVKARNSEVAPYGLKLLRLSMAT